LSGAAYAGGLATSGLLGGLGGYAVGSIGDKLLGANTYSGTTGAIGGATGAIIGSIVPGIGTLIGGIAGSLLGSVVGGLFGKTSITGTATGIDVFGNATANSAEGQEWGRTDYKKKSWFSSSSWSDWKYAGFTDDETNAIKNVVKSYDYLLSEMDIAKKLTVDGGRFDSIQDFLDKNVTQAFIDATGNNRDIYDVWVNYAKNVNKQVYEAFASQINQFIEDKRSFNEYVFGIHGDTIGALNYKADYLQKDFETLEKTLGVTGITVDNFTQRFDEAFKKNLTPQTLANWENLGNTLRELTDTTISLSKAQEQAQLELINAVTSNLNSITNAWLGNLSYLNSTQKTEYSTGLYSLSQNNPLYNSTQTAQAMIENAMKTSRTKEEYIPVFDTYIGELEKNIPTSNLDDVVGRLDTLIDRVEELENTQRQTA